MGCFSSKEKGVHPGPGPNKHDGEVGARSYQRGASMFSPRTDPLIQDLNAPRFTDRSGKSAGTSDDTIKFSATKRYRTL
jgi:hypothetical protein